MSSMRTSCASFSCARPAIRRACSIGVSGSSGPFLLASSVAAVEAALLDLPSNARRDQVVDPLPARKPLAHVAGGDLRRSELEADDAVAVALQVRRRVAGSRA